jgi:hypothetical protein
MNAKSIWRVAFLLTLAIAAAPSSGCSDAGDSSAVPGPEGGPDSTLDSGVGPGDDTSTPGDDTSSGDDTSVPGNDTGTENDSGVDAADSTVEDTGTGMDSTVPADTGTGHDTGTEMDSSVDTGSGMDSMAEAAQDSEADSAADTGMGKDASEGGGSLVPCTTAGQTNCVQCNGWSDGVCTPTEAIVVQFDIDHGHVTAPGPEPFNPQSGFTMNPCYTCLLNQACLDDTVFADMGWECGDPLTTGTTAECLTTLNCLMTTKCAAEAVSTCFCGTAPVAGTCQGNPAAGPINGACASQIAAGIGFAETDGTDITKNLTDLTRASGKADRILQCAQSNKCMYCWQ